MHLNEDQGTVALFPGQGSLTAGAGAPWRACAAWSIVDEVSTATNVDVERLLLECSNEDMVRTDRAQLGTFALSLVAWTQYLENRPAPRYLAGHSLGEFTSLVAAGVLSRTEGSRLVAARGHAMRVASESTPGTMIALMGPSDTALAQLNEQPDVWIANVNGPGQIVASGTLDAVANVAANARELGWRRATPLAVGGAFHSPLMAPAQAALNEALDNVEFRDTDHEIAAGADGQWHRGGDQWRALLAAQLTSTVQFLAVVEALPVEVVRAVEMAPAGVLSGLVKRIRSFDEITGLTEPTT